MLVFNRGDLHWRNTVFLLSFYGFLVAEKVAYLPQVSGNNKAMAIKYKKLQFRMLIFNIGDFGSLAQQNLPIHSI